MDRVGGTCVGDEQSCRPAIEAAWPCRETFQGGRYSQTFTMEDLSWQSLPFWKFRKSGMIRKRENEHGLRSFPNRESFVPTYDKQGAPPSACGEVRTVWGLREDVKTKSAHWEPNVLWARFWTGPCEHNQHSEWGIPNGTTYRLRNEESPAADSAR